MGPVYPSLELQSNSARDLYTYGPAVMGTEFSRTGGGEGHGTGSTMNGKAIQEAPHMKEI